MPSPNGEHPPCAQYGVDVSRLGIRSPGASAPVDIHGLTLLSDDDFVLIFNLGAILKREQKIREFQSNEYLMVQASQRESSFPEGSPDRVTCMCADDSGEEGASSRSTGGHADA